MKLDNLLKYMKLNEDDDYDDDYLDDEDEMEEEAMPPRKSVAPAKQVRETVEYEERPRKATQPKVTPIRQTASAKKPQATGGMEVCVIKPTSFEESREITETLLSNRTVVLNLEGLDMNIAQRIVDFASGSTFAIGGNLQKISYYIFIITPPTVDISGDFSDIFGGALDMPLSNSL
ncbi:MAG: cell division protein SepF [Lachnospiraceae bacterium]|nr:cell division protein SepF [Lachnospiraceae bacterium]